jgi:signal peptidase I
VLTRALFGIVLFTGLRFLLYEPMCALGRAFYVPVLVSGMTLGTIIQDGDALMYQGRWTRPDRFQRGSIVVYRIHGMRRAGVILRDGIGVDRIVGEPGDLVELRQGVLFVNNEPLTEAMQPLGRSNIMLPEQARVLGHGEYLIFPSRLNLAVHGNVQAAPLVGRVSCVRAENILGRVVFRLHPWSGFGAVQDGIS